MSDPPTEPLAVVLGLRERLERLRRVTDGDGTAAEFDEIGDDWELPERTTALLGGGARLDWSCTGMIR